MKKLTLMIAFAMALAISASANTTWKDFKLAGCLPGAMTISGQVTGGGVARPGTVWLVNSTDYYTVCQSVTTASNGTYTFPYSMLYDTGYVFRACNGAASKYQPYEHYEYLYPTSYPYTWVQNIVLTAGNGSPQDCPWD